MFEILPTAALKLLVQPVVPQPAPANGMEAGRGGGHRRAVEASLTGRQGVTAIRLQTEEPAER